jgi:hypothetical protein
MVPLEFVSNQFKTFGNQQRLRARGPTHIVKDAEERALDGRFPE